MLREVEVRGQFEYRDHVKDHGGHLICKGMHVSEAGSRRLGVVQEVVDDGNDDGRIKVVVYFDKEYLKETYDTDFVPASSWCRALFEG